MIAIETLTTMMVSTIPCALLFPIVAAVHAAAEPNLFHAQLLSKYVESNGARCLDGTPGRYWINLAEPHSKNATKWSFHFEGGGWCESESSCAKRAFSEKCYLGSSDPACFLRESGNMMPGNLSAYNATMNYQYIPSCLGSRWCGGLMNNDPSVDPLTHDWNKVFLEYCDGGSFSGNNETVVEVVYDGKPRTMYYRGFRILQSVLDDLHARFNLGEASHAIVGGASAGGLATYYHADYLQSRIPQATVRAAPDSGYFLSTPLKPAWPAALTWISRAMNNTAALNQNCVEEALQGGKDPSVVCVLPEDSAPRVDVPLFVMNSRFDPAMDSISAGIGGSNDTAVREVGAMLLGSVRERVLGAGAGKRGGEGEWQGHDVSRNVAFITACHEHCGQWGQGQVLGPGGKFDDFNVTIEGSTGAVAADRWWRWLDAGAPAGGGGLVPGSRLWLQGADYPCEDCCSGGQ